MYTMIIGKDKPNADRLRKNQERMMTRGIRVKNINTLSSQYEKIRDDLKGSIEDEYGIGNINSYAQVAGYLQSMSSKVPYGEVNDYINTCYQDGKWVTDQYALNKLSALGYKFANDMLEYREAKSNAEKVRSIKDSIIDGRMHPSVSLAKTNRVNYSKPALGQINKELLREIIEPLSDDEVIYSIDIKNQEPGILINALKDPELLKALNSPDGLYETMFRWVYRPFTEMTLLNDALPEDRIYTQKELSTNIMVPPDSYIPMEAPCLGWEIDGKRIQRVQRICQGISEDSVIIYPETIMVECIDGTVTNTKVTWEKSKKGKVVGWLDNIEVRISPQERKEFKTSFLAITYGASSVGIEKQCKIINAKLLYKKITSLKGMANYRSQCSAAANKGITSLRTVFGTVVSTDKVGSANELRRSLLSIPIQGTGADILDLLITHFEEESKKAFKENAPYIYFTRHDELMICVKKEILTEYGEEKFKQWLNDTMEHRIGDSTPFKVEISRIE